MGLLSGCPALLERSYGVSEPYADRYWDSSAEDTLRVESYQDLVNSLLLLVEQRAEEGISLSRRHLLFLPDFFIIAWGCGFVSRKN